MELITSRAISGMYFAAQETYVQPSWVNALSNYFESDQVSETYAMLGATPKMRKWKGGRDVQELSETSFTILNEPYEATLLLKDKDRRMDKTGQVQIRVNEMAIEPENQWAEMLVDLIQNGASWLCYDNQYYFDTDHVEGDSGTQSNKISVDISALPADVHGTVTAPSVGEMQQAITQGIKQILSFKDNKGKLINRNARAFVVTVPLGLWETAVAAVATITTAAMQQNLNPNVVLQDITVSVALIPDLTWTDTFAVWRTDAPIKPLIRQEEKKPTLLVLGENSDHYFLHQEVMVGVDANRGAGYGRWQYACQVIMI